MSDSRGKVNQALERVENAKQCIQELAQRVIPNGDDKNVSEDELRNGLHDLFQAIKTGCQELTNGRISDAEADEKGIRRDVLETWQDAKQLHLPVSLALLRKRVAEPQPSDRSTDEVKSDRPSVLLLMAGYSIEQLVLCIAINYYERGVRDVVPFAGKTSSGGHCWDAKTIMEWLTHLGVIVGTEEDCKDDSELLRIAPPQVVEASNPAKVFRSILDWSRHERKQGYDCWLDVTGGQKPMDSGASYAAMYLGWNAWYLDFADYDSDLRRPTPESLRYQPLVLPSVAFSHSARREVVTHFRDRRFRAALERLSSITEWGKRPEFREYFPPEDLREFGEAEGTLRQCVALMGANYPAACLEALRLSLHAHFTSEKESLRNKLHGLMKPTEAGGEDPLLQYVCDEYWRLETLLRLAEGSPETDDLQVAYSEGIREVIVGSVGLSELIVDALFQLPAGELKVCKVTSLGSENVKKWLTDAVSNSQYLEAVKSELEGKTLPFHRVPPAVTRSKAELVRGNIWKLSLWCPVTSIQKSGDAASFATAVANEFRGAEAVEYSSKKLVIDVKASLSRAQPLIAVDGDSDDWNLLFGDFGNGDAEWFRTRHLIAHMRAPMQQEQFDLARRAIHKYLPRFIGLLAALRQGSASLPMSADTTHTLGTAVVNDTKESIPWYAPNAEATLCRQLQLPV